MFIELIYVNILVILTNVIGMAFAILQTILSYLTQN